MNDLEFQTQYKRLKECHPFMYSSKEKAESIWKFVHDMDASWFEKMVDNICAGSDPKAEKYDIGLAVIGEKRARRSAQFADNLCEATKNWARVTETGLENVLEKYSSGSLVEAVLKSKRGEV